MPFAIPLAAGAASPTFGGPLPLWASGALTAGMVLLVAGMVAYAAAVAGRRRAREGS